MSQVWREFHGLAGPGGAEQRGAGHRVPGGSGDQPGGGAWRGQGDHAGDGRGGVEGEIHPGAAGDRRSGGKVVDRVLSREINPEIVTAIEALAGRARGFAGTIFSPAESWGWPGRRANGWTSGFVGEVKGVKTAPLRKCIEGGITPVISPTARGKDGRIYNCNADVAAAQAAIALKAKRLVFMSDVPGLLRNPKDPASVIAHLRVNEVNALKDCGVIDHGMSPEGGQRGGGVAGRRGEGVVCGRPAAARGVAGDLHGSGRGNRGGFAGGRIIPLLSGDFPATHFPFA